MLAICAQGDGLRFMRVEEGACISRRCGFSMRQLGTTGTYGGREYMKSLVLQDRALEEKGAGQAEADDAYTEAMNEIADALEQSPAFASMSGAEMGLRADGDEEAWLCCLMHTCSPC